jgi:hypothetical protein
LVDERVERRGSTGFDKRGGNLSNSRTGEFMEPGQNAEWQRAVRTITAVALGVISDRG